ncbi:MAG: type II secretion system protein GspM [Betaproteobacteria bacterium]
MSARAAWRDRLGTSLAPALLPVTQRWHRLDRRRQRFALAAGTLLVAALVFAYVWLPAARERDRLTARLPQLAAQLARMQQQADEVRQLQSTSALAPVPPTAADIASLQAAFGEGSRVSFEPNRAFRVVIPKIAYATWWDRLGDVQSRHQLELASMALQALPGSNREVSIDMLLAERARGSAAPTAGPAR